MYKKTTLDNGLRIITVPSNNTKAVTVMALVGAGSKYENKEINGVSHFLEHLFFKGTAKRKDKIEIADPIDKVGGVFNAFTGQDYSAYFAKVASRDFELAMDWVSDIYLNSTLPAQEIEMERGVITEEFNMYFDNPMLYLGEMWPMILYGDQPAGWSIIGAKETISKLTRQQIAAYRDDHYVAARTIVIVAGNVGPQKALAAAKKYFASVKTSAAAPKPQVYEQQSAPNILLENRKTDQTHLALGVRAYNLFHPKRYTLELLSIILGGMMSSRLFVEIREKLGIAYDIKTDANIDPETGSLVTVAGMDTKRIDTGISAILAEYKKIASMPIPEIELKKAKDNFIGRTTLALESSSQLASFYAIQEILEEKVLEPEQVFKKINHVTVGDIQEVARDIFQPNKLNLAIIGPYDDKSRFLKLLEGALK